MTMKTEPFLSGKWGWDLGENNWKDGADENFLKFAYMLNGNVDGFVSSLPGSPTNGTAYFLTTDMTLNARIDSTWYKFPTPKGFVVTEHSTGNKYEFNGSSFVATLNATDKVKLNGITSGATANATDAALRDRSTHTGTQAISTITSLQTSLDAKAPLNSPALTGTPTAPTVTGSDDSTKLATTAWVKLQGYSTGTSAVTTVAGRAGDVTLTPTDVGLPNVDNTADTAKPISTATQTALNLKADKASPTFTGTVVLPSSTSIGTLTALELSYLHGVTSNVQGQIDAITGVTGGYAPLNSPAFTGTVTGITKAMVGLGNVDNTSDVSKPISTATQTALNLKADKANPVFSGKISGDFSNTTILSRVLVQTSSANNVTRFDVIPSGTATTATLGAFNNSDPTNAAWARLTATSADVRVESTISGTGTYLPLNLYTSGNLQLSIALNGVATFTNSIVTNGSMNAASYSGAGVSSSSSANTLVKRDASGDIYSNNGNFSTDVILGGSVRATGNLNGSGINLIGGAPVLIWQDNNSPSTTMTPYISFRDNTAAEVGWIGYGAGNGEIGISNQSRNIKFYSPVVMQNNLDVAGAITATNGANFYNAATGNVLNLNTGGTYGVLNLQKGGVSRGLLAWDSSQFTLNDANGNNRIVITNGSTQIIGLQGDGSSLTNLNASNLSSGTLSNSRLAFSISTASSASTVVQRDGSGDIYGRNLFAVGGYVQASGGGGFLSDAYVANSQNPIWRFANALGYGISYFHGTAGYGSQDTIGMHFGTASVAGSGFKFRADGYLFATGFAGDGSNLTSLNAGALSAGTLPDARLSSNVALVSNVITKSTPSQLFQNIGTVNGSVTINGSNGIHVIATINGNTTWTFPTPSSTEVIAITLELTNGGSFINTWPSGIRWSGAVAPSLTLTGTDVLVFTKAGTGGWRGYISSKDSR